MNLNWSGRKFKEPISSKVRFRVAADEPPGREQTTGPKQSNRYEPTVAEESEREVTGEIPNQPEKNETGGPLADHVIG